MVGKVKVLFLNTVYGTGSTGRIVKDLYDAANSTGIDAYVAYGYSYKNIYSNEKFYKIESVPELKYSILQTKLFGSHGFYNHISTRRLIRWIDTIEPDVIHLHNMHGHYLNVELLFDYIKEKNIKTVWTLHDCWAFTGHCIYYDYINCEKWKNGCGNCNQLNTYPYTWFFDRSTSNYKRKNKVLNGVPQMQIVTVSRWLENQVRESFLKKYPVQTIYNGIDLETFHPINTSIRTDAARYELLGVASPWSLRKGLDDFIALSEILDDNYHITLVGLDEKQLKKLPKRISGFRRTDSIRELVELYSTADVFVNCSVEETMGMTTLEALACGTPVVVYNATAVPEVPSESCGIVVPPRDVEALAKAITNIINMKIPHSVCRKRAEDFQKDKQIKMYLDLYYGLI